MKLSDFLDSVKAVDGSALKAAPFVVLDDGRKVTYAVDSPDDFDASTCAAAIAATGCKGKISSGAAKGARRGIGGSFELPAGNKSALQFVDVWDSVREVGKVEIDA